MNDGIKDYSIISVILFFGIIGLLAISCSDEALKYDTDYNVVNGSTYNLHIEDFNSRVNSFKMSLDKRHTLRKLMNNDPVDFDLLTNLWIEDQVMYFNLDLDKEGSATNNASTEEIKDYITKISSVNTTNLDPYSFKKNYEKNIKSILNLELKYRKHNGNLTSIFKKSSYNSYSLTILNQIIWRLNRDNFKKYSPVIIFTENDIYPGYILKEDNKLNLIGLDTSSFDSRYILNFGDLLNYNGITVRVVDAELFAIMDIFKNNIINVEDLAKEILEKTASKYGFTLNDQYALGATRIPDEINNLNLYLQTSKAEENPFSFINVQKIFY